MQPDETSTNKIKDLKYTKGKIELAGKGECNDMSLLTPYFVLVCATKAAVLFCYKQPWLACNNVFGVPYLQCVSQIILGKKEKMKNVK